MGTTKETFGTSTNLSAFGTSLASQIGINLDNSDSFLHCFVGDEVLQLSKTPSTQPEVEPLSLPNFPYVLEVLDNNSSCIAVIDYLFADYMVPVSLETSLPARNLLEQFLGRAGAFALEPCSQSLEFNPVLLDFSSTEELPIGSYSNVIYSEVNAQMKSVRNGLDVNLSGKCDVQEHTAFVESEPCSLVVPVKVFPIVLWDFQGNLNSTIRGCELDSVKQELGASLVEVQRHTFLKGRFSTFASLDAFECLRSYAVSINDELCWEIEFLSDIIITEMMKFVSVGDVSFNSFVSDKGDSFGVLHHHAEKSFIALNFELDSSYGLHRMDNVVLIYKLDDEVTSGSFLPQINLWVSRPTFL